MSRVALTTTDVAARRRWQHAWMVMSAIWATMSLVYGYSLWTKPIPNFPPAAEIRCETRPAIETTPNRAAIPAPAARPINPWEESVSAYLDERDDRQRAAMRRAPKTLADLADEVRRLAAYTGLPESFVERNFDDIVKELTRISKPSPERIEELSTRFMVSREAIERNFEIYERAGRRDNSTWVKPDSDRDLKQQACDLHDVTGLPAGFVYDHILALRASMRKDGFSAEAFRQRVIRAAEESREAARRLQRQEAVSVSIVLSTGPPIALFFLGHSVAWVRRFLKQASARPAILKIATYAAFPWAFICFWIAAAEDQEPPFTEEQWRLLGWTLLATAIAITWRQRTPSFSAPAEPTAGHVSSPAPLPKSEQEMGAGSHTTWRCPRCRRLNRPGSAVCACGHSYDPASHDEATDASILESGGATKGRDAKLKWVWMALGVAGAVAFVVINVMIGRRERVLATLISTLVQVVGLTAFAWLLNRAKNSFQKRRGK